MKKEDVAELCKSHRDISKRGLAAQYDNTTQCRAFYNGDQMTYSDRIQFADTFGRKKSALVNFNDIQSPVDTLVGFMSQNRRQAKYIARLNADAGQQLYSRNMNVIYSFHRENTNADQLESQRDADMVQVGFGAIDTDLSYIIGNAATMPNGEIAKLKLDPMSTYWDPSAKDQNLLKSRWCGYFQDYELESALDLFKGSTEEDFENVDEEDENGGYIFNPYGGIYDKIKESNAVEWTGKDQNMVRVYNHQWFQYETFYKAENPIYMASDPLDALYFRAKLDAIKAEIIPQGPEDIPSQDLFDFDPLAQTLTFDDQIKSALVKEFGSMITPVSFKRKVYYTAVVSGDHVFSWFKSISQQGFSIKFVTGVYNHSNKIWTGMINPMMEPQKYKNKALTELMFTIASNSKGGVYVEEDAVEDIADFESKQARTDAVIVVRSGAISLGKIQDKAKPALPTGLDTIVQLSDAALIQNSMNPAFMGDIEKQDQSGILYKRRIRQVISKFAMYFDSDTLALKEDARLNGDLIPVWLENNEGEWLRITGPDGAEDFERMTKDMLAPEYDVSIQEAPQTPEDKQETAVLLGSYGDKVAQINPQAALGFYAKSLQFISSLDGQTRNELTQMLQPKDQIDPMQVAQMQQELQRLQQIIQSGELAKTESETKYNLARAAQMEANVSVTQAKVPNTQADTALKLENAQKAATEAAVMVVNPDKEVQVTV